MIRFRPVLFCALALAAPAFAQDLPPAGSMLLSELILEIERTQPVSMVVGAEWDSNGYWELEYVDTSDLRVEIRVDPITAEILPR